MHFIHQMENYNLQDRFVDSRIIVTLVSCHLKLAKCLLIRDTMVTTRWLMKTENVANC